MHDQLFRSLRRRMTLHYSLVFGTACLLVVALTCGLVWLGVLRLEQDSLADTAVWAAAEQQEAQGGHQSDSTHNGRHAGQQQGRRMGMGMGRNNGSHRPLPSADKNILQVLQTPRGLELTDSQRQQEAAPLLALQDQWPRQDRQVLPLTARDDAGVPLHYLALRLPLSPGCSLYVFKDISGYYQLAASLLPLLALLLTLLLGAAVALSWWLAGRSLGPVEEMYLRQQQFTSDASHELRTPLNVLGLALRALDSDKETSLSPFAKKNLAIMAEESSRLERLTEELLLLTRSDSGRLSPATEQVDLAALAGSVLEHMALPAAERDIFIRSEGSAPLILQGHADSLRRLLVILLDNAVKYSPQGSDIAISWQAERDRAVLRVADWGPGISDEEKPLVLGRFYRGDRARTRSAGGTGLGLALAAAIVRQHQGSLTIKDNQPQGTIMEVSLPLK